MIPSTDVGPMISSGAAVPRRYRRIAAAAVAATTGATLALILIVLILPARAAQALHWYLVIIGAIAAVAAIRALTARYPVRWQATLDPLPRVREMPPEIPTRLRAIHRWVSRSRWDPAGFHLEFRPILRAIAAQRLATYRMIDMDDNPEAARAALGERVWTLLIPVDLMTARGDRTVDLADVRAAVERLEKLHDIADD